MRLADILDIAVNVVGVLGFFLSVALAVREAMKSRLRLVMFSVQAWLFSDPGDTEVTHMFRIVAGNKSRSPVAIIGMALCYGGKSYPVKISNQVKPYGKITDDVINLSGGDAQAFYVFVRTPREAPLLSETHLHFQVLTTTRTVRITVKRRSLPTWEYVRPPV